jgi:hypothetical protein
MGKKGHKKLVKIINQNIGGELRQDYLDEIDYKGTFLPKSIFYEDIDKAFLKFVDEILEIEIDGEKVPMMFLTITKWAEFTKTWDISDKFKNIKMPFIVVVRQPDIQVGTNQAGIWNIPGEKLYTYLKIPNGEGGRRGVDTYKIPQPTSVDLTYDVRLFCNRMRDLNLFNRTTQLTFQSRQYYIKVNEHPMPIHLEKIGDESQKDLDKRRYYVQRFEMKVLGYILDENDFELLPTINRAIVFTEIIDKEIKPKITIRALKDVDEISLKVVIKPDYFSDEFEINCGYKITISSIEFVENVSNVDISVNGIPQTIPFTVKANETITLSNVVRNETQETLLILKGLIK